MKIYGDYHTHSIFSKNNHGKSTIDENCYFAQKKGLKQIAITDHGYSHKKYGVELKEVENIKNEINNAKQKYDIDVLYGIEANLLNFGGEIDLPKDKEKEMDIVVMGYHSFARGKNFFKNIAFHYPNYFARIFGTCKWLINKNTEAYLKALDNNNIDILSHLNSKCKVDIEKIAKKCVEKNTYIELNGRRICFTNEEVKTMLDLNVKFVVNSDAHYHKDIANFSYPIKFSIENGIPLNRICNLNELPKFKNHKEN